MRARATVPAVTAALPDLSSDYAVPDDRVDEFAREGHTVLREVCTRDEVAAYRPVIEAATKKHTTVIYFADGLRAAEADHGFRWHDLKMWLPGVEPGELAASPLNPRLYP